MREIVCRNCGFSVRGVLPEEGEVRCIHCDGIMGYAHEPSSGGDPAGDGESVRTGTARVVDKRHALVFTGTAPEYFRIWIVNILLTIVTFGFYAAWAKVRTRQYFYGNTMLAGTPFSFLGNPRAILKGNMIIGGVFLLVSVFERIVPMVASGILIAFYIFLPYLIYKSYRFNLRNSSFRNIRFGFAGTAGESYIVYLLGGALLPLSLGLLYPYWTFRRKTYFLENLTYGKTNTLFSGRPGKFYRIYITAALSFLLALVLLFLVIYAGSLTIMSVSIPFHFDPLSLRHLFVLAPFGLPLIILPLQQLINAAVFNYCWPETRIGRVRFESTISVRRFLWIRMSNLVAIIFTIGLLLPWAKVRFVRYLLANVTIIAPGGLDDFTGSAVPAGSALGDAATDFFDIGFGI